MMPLKENPARVTPGVTKGSLGSHRIVVVLDRVFAEHGPPEWLRSDNGPELIARAVRARLAESGSKPRYIDPGCPWQNAYGESFNGRLRDECLNLQLFASRGEAAVVIEAWRRDDNTERPHSSLGYRTPSESRAAAVRGAGRRSRLTEDPQGE